MTIPRLELSISNSFEHGQAYVALSRATSLEGTVVSARDVVIEVVFSEVKIDERVHHAWIRCLHSPGLSLKSFDPTTITAHPKVVAFFLPFDKHPGVFFTTRDPLPLLVRVVRAITSGFVRGDQGRRGRRGQIFDDV
jgi:hypothetical protein